MDKPVFRDKAEFARFCDKLRASGQRLVTVNGCFDLLHSGHIHILREARRQGDALVVGLNSDASVRGYKGDGRPILGEDERAAILLALEPVDGVCIYDEAECMPFIEAARPDVHVNDASYGEDCIEAETCRRLGARLHLVEKREGRSTTDILRRIQSGASPSSDG